ncbi:MAG TPA: FN3 associated domain-containing protein [Terracidiphilus sp.]
MKILARVNALALSLSFITPLPPLQAQPAGETPLGMAWQVRGAWHEEGASAPLRTGDAIQPGSLLLASAENVKHSIVVLLPDGQLVVYDCFTAEDCARGFRVPSLYRSPEPFALDMVGRIRTVLIRDGSGSSTGSGILEPSQAPRLQQSGLPREEAMVVLNTDNQVQVAGLAAHLPNGHYTYDLRPLDRAHPRRSHLALEKSGASIAIALPSAGLYDLTIVDDLNTPRIDLFIAAVEPTHAARLAKSFHDAVELMKDWNKDYEGWPIHEFQRAYLESLMLNLKASHGGALGGSGRAAAMRSGVSAEPAFSPRPGLLNGDTAISVRCSTPGATMHFTVDGSQPVDSSPVYHGPIMVRGTELTIKAFARAPGKKDSPVVTGTFRIKEQ